MLKQDVHCEPLDRHNEDESEDHPRVAAAAVMREGGGARRSSVAGRIGRDSLR
jgi:hypothetical protein